MGTTQIGKTAQGVADSAMHRHILLTGYTCQMTWGYCAWNPKSRLRDLWTIEILQEASLLHLRLQLVTQRAGRSVDDQPAMVF